MQIAVTRFSAPTGWVEKRVYLDNDGRVQKVQPERLIPKIPGATFGWEAERLHIGRRYIEPSIVGLNTAASVSFCLKLMSDAASMEIRF